MFSFDRVKEIPSIAFVDGLHGLGDNIFQRPFVNDLSRRMVTVWLRTPWPQLYQDIANVSFVRCPSGLRTQAKNLALLGQNKFSYVLRSVAEGSADVRLRMFYHSEELKKTSITGAFRLQVPPRDKLVFDLPKFHAPKGLPKPYIVVRPATIRTEWKNPARNPDPSYLAEAVEALKSRYTIISVADLEAGVEDLEGEPPYADICYHRGELNVMDLLGLVRHAAGCIGGVGWLLPAAVAYRVPILLILGGMGGHNAPYQITDPDQDLSKVVWATPDNFCMCEAFFHPCPKFISNFGERVDEFKSILAAYAAEHARDIA
jgi:hypothetical protein